MQDIALEVDDVRTAYETACGRGAIGVAPPALLEDEHGVYEFAVIRAYGDTTHTFVNRDRYGGVFAPGYKPLDADRYSPRTFRPTGLKAIDHVVGNVEEGKMDEWVRFYENVLGFSQLVHFDDKDISTEYSALMSKVVQGGGGRIKFPINEPAKSRRRSQIEEYLTFYNGPGVQHIALATDDIMETVRALRHNDVSFLKVPPAYYDMLPGASAPLRRTWPSWPSWASWWTATTKATCCRFSRSRWRTGRRCSSRSSSGAGPRASARATSRRCSRPSKANRRGAGRCKGGVSVWVGRARGAKQGRGSPLLGAAGSPLSSPHCVNFGGANVVAFVVEALPVPVPAGTADERITQFGLTTMALGCTTTGSPEMSFTATN